MDIFCLFLVLLSSFCGGGGAIDGDGFTFGGGGGNDNGGFTFGGGGGGNAGNGGFTFGGGGNDGFEQQSAEATTEHAPTTPSSLAIATLDNRERLVLHLDFNATSGNVVKDSSGYANNGYLKAGAILVNFQKSKCGNAAYMQCRHRRYRRYFMPFFPRAYTQCGDIVFHGDTFQAKPYKGVTIAAWINLKETAGLHSIFDTIGSTHTWGQYHFEVNNGMIRWFHRNESQTIIFSNTAKGQMVKKDTWTHIVGTYDSASGKSKIYVNGYLLSMTIGAGLLSRDWASRAGIGNHRASRPLMGYIDDFRIYNYALTRADIVKLFNKCGLLPKPPVSMTTTKAPSPTTQVTPKCNVQALGMQNGDILDSRITASSFLQSIYRPEQGRLHYSGDGGFKFRPAWEVSAGSNRLGEWIQVDLGNVTDVTGVATQGNGRIRVQEWVTSYSLQSSADGSNFEDYQGGKSFDGNRDPITVVKHDLEPPIRARYIRLVPKTWHNWIALRMELYGQCSKALGMQSRAIPDSSITASSYYHVVEPPEDGRLHNQHESRIKQGTWSPVEYMYRHGEVEWLQVDLGKVTMVTAIATQGRPSSSGYNQWVKSYSLKYSNNGCSFHDYFGGKVIDGNRDGNTVVKHELVPPNNARYVRIYPKTWEGWAASLRMELYGCKSAVIEEATEFRNDAFGRNL